VSHESPSCIQHSNISSFPSLPPSVTFAGSTRSTQAQPCIPLGSLNRVPALIGWGKGGNFTSAGWQVIVCDPVWHVSSRSGAVLVAQTAIRLLTLPYLGLSRNSCVPEHHFSTSLLLSEQYKKLTASSHRQTRPNSTFELRRCEQRSRRDVTL